MARNSPLHAPSMLISIFLALTLGFSQPNAAHAASPSSPAGAPTPLLEKGKPVNWWFAYKFNVASFPDCGAGATRACPFGGTPQTYKSGYSQQFVYASAGSAHLKKGGGCLGSSVRDPVGATFDQVYNGSLYYVVWNDQFYGDPKISDDKCKGTYCDAPWGHSKGMLAWNEAGQGVVLQVTTPSWPASGSAASPRAEFGNTLGCVVQDDVKFAQHFFALKLTKDDLAKVLKALANASVVTDPKNAQIVKNGGPSDVQALVRSLGRKSNSIAYTYDTLSSGVQLISKPSDLNVPPWQLVSSVLGGIGLRTATWWAAPEIYTTTKSTKMQCWNPKLKSPGPVEIATTGQWDGTEIGLKSGQNHAKLGVSLGEKGYAIFGDMNQSGSISGNCTESQNGRGGLFYVLQDKTLSADLAKLIKGDTAPTHASKAVAATK